VNTVIVAAAALFFLGMGVLALIRPAALVAPFGISLSGPEGRLEVCAVYGGFGIAIAALLGVAALDPGAHRGEVLAVAVALFGMAGGRLLGRIRDRPGAFYPIWFYFWVEVVAGVLLVVAVSG
jgi:uncharacterized protein DUF4345